MPNLKIDFLCRKDDNRGIYYGETKRALIFLGMHEDLNDICKTINHEVLHHCLSELEETDEVDEEQEERVIYIVQWADEYIA